MCVQQCGEAVEGRNVSQTGVQSLETADLGVAAA